ncbi:MAG TPA: hypothetical protein VMI75_29065 [Polyangiaceae bacterium]|nr:hypothetical protein [Polyangiaceae bacterium]
MGRFRLVTAIAMAMVGAACRHERPGSHARCGGMTYPPLACPAGEQCVDVPDGCDSAHGGHDCPTYCVTAQPPR